MCLIIARRGAVDLTDLQKWAVRAEKIRHSDFWSQKEDMEQKESGYKRKNVIDTLL